jgi:adenylate cyclase
MLAAGRLFLAISILRTQSSNQISAMHRSFLKKIVLGAGLGLLAAAVVLLITNFLFPTVFRNFEAKTYDFRFFSKVEYLHEQRQGENIEDLVIVDIDNRSLEKLGRYSQWPRRYHTRLIDYLRASGAACIAFDILFMERDTNRVEDSLLVLSTQNASNVVHALAFSAADENVFLYKMDRPPEGFDADRFTLRIPREMAASFDSVDRFDGKVVELYNSSAALGFANFLPDEDGVIRTMPLFLNFGGQTYPSLALAVVMQFAGLDADDIEIELGREVHLGKTADNQPTPRIPIDEHGRALINYMGTWKTFRSVSYYDVLERRLPAEMFRNKVVLIGTSVAGLFDLRPVPFQADFPGVEIHANIIYNILIQDFITQPPKEVSVAGMLIFAMLVGIVTMLLSPWLGIALTFMLGAGYAALSVWLFVYRNLWMTEVQPLFAVALAFLGVIVYRYLSEEREKRLIKGMFVHYTSELIVNELLRNPGMLKLGGERKYATAFFSDIKNFTTISEEMPAEQLITYLNEYLSAMTDIVFEYGGYLDKYEGDAVVAVFGVPVDQTDHAERACFAALDMQWVLVKLRKKWLVEKRRPFEARIGLNSGYMIAGNIGGKNRFDYTVIGDSVNLASRLEGANKMYGTNIIISEETCDLVKDKIIARELDFIRVKGKTRPVRIYELLARRSDGIASHLGSALTHFARGLECYRLQDWQKAITEFRKVLETKPNDGPAKEFLRRCDIFLQSPRPPDWDGVFEMRTK